MKELKEITSNPTLAVNAFLVHMTSLGTWYVPCGPWFILPVSGEKEMVLFPPLCTRMEETAQNKQSKREQILPSTFVSSSVSFQCHTPNGCQQPMYVPVLQITMTPKLIVYIHDRLQKYMGHFIFSRANSYL